LRAVASGLIIEKVRSIAMDLPFRQHVEEIAALITTLACHGKHLPQRRGDAAVSAFGVGR
ncbi:MAG: hypothetical protein NTZ72_17855, partial [Afipia sp.]|nr:hypothetical protein [Afipia sp.]